LTPRLVGLSQGDPYSARTNSGVAKFLFDALERRYEMPGRFSVELTAPQRALTAALAFHPSRGRWRGRYYWQWALANRLRSRNAAARLRGLDGDFDLAVQIFSLFQSRGAPYVLYTDNTMAITLRHNPGWAPDDPRSALDWERKVFGEARHLFVVGRIMADSMIEDYGVPEERISIVSGGSNFHPLPEPKQRTHEPVILFVGRFWEHKGGPPLLEAFREIRSQLPDARLVVLGTDEPRPEPGVEVLGTIDDRERVAELYANAAVFCLPSRWEGFGGSLAEAMGHSLPCVTTAVGALPEVVLHEETGLVVPPEDPDALGAALLRILSDPEYGDELGRAGRRRVEEYLTWDATAERMGPGLESALQA
jgi:alpha-maltose-1-phosphate synthase